MKDGRAGNGRHRNSRLAYRLVGKDISLRDRLLKHLIVETRAGRETSSKEANAVGGNQYGARCKELRDDGWEISNRVERTGRRARGWFRIDFDKMRTPGRHDLLAIAFPENYPNGAARIPPPPGDTLPLFGEGGQ